MTFYLPLRPSSVRLFKPSILFLICAAAVGAHARARELQTTEAVLERYKQALGGADAIQKVESETVSGEAESSNAPGKSTFVYYVKGFKSIFEMTRPDGSQINAGFDGKVSWTITAKGASIDNAPIEANLRDGDLHYALHQPDYFKKLEFGGVVEFEGHRCYRLHGTTKWDTDEDQFYDVRSGLLAGSSFVSGAASKAVTVALFQDYKKFGGPLIATRNVSRVGGRTQTFIYKRVSYEPLDDSVFDLPEAVKALNNSATTQ